MILLRSISFLFILFHFESAFGQIKENDCNFVNIEKLKTSQVKHLYKSKEKEIRLLYIQNQFNDSIAIFINDSLVSLDYYKTDFSSGATGKIIKFKYVKNKKVRIKFLIGTEFNSSKKEVYININNSILKKNKLFFFYKLECGFNLFYSNYIPYYE